MKLLREPEEMCKAFQEHFVQLFGGSGGPDSTRDLTDFLTGLPQLSGQVAERCEGPIKPVEVIDAIADCKPDKAPGLDGLPYELYKSMPDVFEDLLVEIFHDLATERGYPQICAPGSGHLDQKGSRQRGFFR